MPCHSSSGYSLASRLGGPCSIPGQIMWDLWGGKSGTGAGFHLALRFPLPIPTSPTATYSLDAASSTLYCLNPASVPEMITAKKWPQWQDTCIKTHKKPQIGYEVIRVDTHGCMEGQTHGDDTNNNAACRSVTRQRPHNKQPYNSHC
jgi:hypothetical protein